MEDERVEDAEGALPVAVSRFPPHNGKRLSNGPFWRSRLASEAIGILQILAGILALLALMSYDPKDPNIFSWTAGGEAANCLSLIQLYRRSGQVALGSIQIAVVVGIEEGRPLKEGSRRQHVPCFQRFEREQGFVWRSFAV